MNIESFATVEGRPLTLLGVPQQLRSFTVTMYRRSWGHEMVQVGNDAYGRSSFRIEEKTPIVWDDHHLSFGRAEQFGVPPIYLDLLWNERTMTWTGALRRGAFAGQVVLRRPSPHRKASPFAGTWKAGWNGCVHIAQAADATFTVWSDQIRMPGLERFAPHLQRPSTTWEYYGRFGTATLIDAQTLQLNGDPFAGGVAGGQMGPTFIKPGLDGKSLIEAGQSPVAQRTWQRQPSGTCIH